VRASHVSVTAAIAAARSSNRQAKASNTYLGRACGGFGFHDQGFALQAHAVLQSAHTKKSPDFYEIKLNHD
jgi:hypothetical protein